MGKVCPPFGGPGQIWCPAVSTSNGDLGLPDWGWGVARRKDGQHKQHTRPLSRSRCKLRGVRRIHSLLLSLQRARVCGQDCMVPPGASLQARTLRERETVVTPLPLPSPAAVAREHLPTKEALFLASRPRLHSHQSEPGSTLRSTWLWAPQWLSG